jgi:hypothetical protein
MASDFTLLPRSITPAGSERDTSLTLRPTKNSFCALSSAPKTLGKAVDGRGRPL